MAHNHDGWEEIFSALPIVEHVKAKGFFDITADKIKSIAGREPRLMAKIDFREHLPPVMAREQMAILAISNGKYRIGRFDPFIDIQTQSNTKAVSIPFPSGIITLNPQKLAHESAALDAALLSHILARVFGEEVALTIRGRSRSPTFSFSLNGIPFPVSGVQVEVDGGYEGKTTINLVEAKIGSRNNMNIRQLIYPQMAWEQIAGGRKRVRSFICFYQEPLLRFIPISFSNGICQADHSGERTFLLEPEARLNLHAIQPRPDAAAPVLGVPFPQADRFETVLAMFNIVVREEEITKEELLQEFDIVPRQIDYYSNAMRWMGLVEINRGIIRLTLEGRSIGMEPHARKIGRMAEIIFREPIFNHALRHGITNVPPALFERWQCSESTQRRRLQTVKAWIDYFEAISQRT
jgi:hypothetical protein